MFAPDRGLGGGAAGRTLTLHRNQPPSTEKNMTIPLRAFRLPACLLCLPLLAFGTAPADPPAKPPAPPVSGNAPNDEAAAPAKPDPAQDKFWHALKLLKSSKPADLAAGRAELQASSDLEFTHAQALLGNCHLSGAYGFAKDPRLAANLFRLAAERGNAFAKVSLGQCYFNGTGVSKDEVKAAEWLAAALLPAADYSRPVPPPDFFTPAAGAKGGTPEVVAGDLEQDPVSESQATAHYLLALIRTRQKKLEDAQPHYVAAGMAGPGGRDGIYQAALQAAVNYAFGYGSARDLPKANEMLAQSHKLVSRLGVSLIHNYVALKIVDEFATADLEESMTKAGEDYETDLQVKLAETFADKKSKEYNPAEAVKWYELAAESGRAWAMLSLAFMYAQGDLGQRDPAKAFHWFEQAGGGAHPKHFLGVANLAICYQNGIGTPKDPEKAAALFKQYRDNDLTCYLGTLGQCPAQILTYEQSLALNFQWAKEKNDPQAQYLLGVRYDNGYGVKVSVAEAAHWYKKAGKANHAKALYSLGLLHYNYSYSAGDDDVAEGKKAAFELYHRSSEMGNTDAMINYAYMLDNGEAGPKDSSQAAAIYEKCLAINPREKIAHNNLGAYFKDRLEEAVKQSHPAETELLRRNMLEHHEEARRLEFARAAKNLAQLYYDGTLVGKDLHKAYVYFGQAADWNYGAYAHYMLGRMHEAGEGVPVTLTEAAYHYRLAALDGNMDALRRLTNFYLTGQGVDLDLDRAAFWLNQMVKRGELGGLIPLSEILIKRGDYDNAIKLLKQLADSDLRVLAGYASEHLSRYYLSGTGVKVNAAKAEKYFDRAVELGNSDALTRLGLKQMAEKNTTEAMANFQKAAADSPNACYFLGQMYYFGTNVPKDETKALRYLHDAADGNHLEALYFLAALTYNRAAGAPTLEAAIRFAQQAETGGLEKAHALREKLEQRRKSSATLPEKSG